jgi:hypothetical protein
MDLKTLLSGGVADLKVEWRGDVIGVRFKEDAYTPKLEAEVLQAADTGGATALADLLVQLVVDWDITQDGEPFPPTPENMATLPVSFLAAVVQSIGSEMASGPLAAKTSDAPS